MNSIAVAPLLQHIQIPIILVDKNLNIKYTNSAFKSVLSIEQIANYISDKIRIKELSIPTTLQAANEQFANIEIDNASAKKWFQLVFSEYENLWLGQFLEVPTNHIVKEAKSEDKRLKVITDNAPVLLKMANARNLYYYFNQRWIDFTGLKSVGSDKGFWLDAVHTEDVAELLKSLDLCYKGRNPYEVQYRLRRHDGVYKLFQDVGVPYTDAEGFFSGYVSCSYEIADRVETQSSVEPSKAISNAQLTVNKSLEQADLLVIGINADDYIIYANSFCKKLLDNKLVLGAFKWSDLFEIRDENVIEVFTWRELIGETDMKQNFSITLKNKQKEHKEFRGNLMLFNSSVSRTTNEAITIVGEDITEQKKSNFLLIENEAKFRRIFESFQDIFIQTNLRGVITNVSPSVTEICGYNADELIGKKITDFFVYNVKIKKSIKELLAKRKIKNLEVKIIDKSGKVLIGICNLHLFRDRVTSTYGFEGTVRDITDLKQTTEELKLAKEVAERSLKIKERFLANMSHEIRTPMNGIIGLIDLLHNTKLNVQQEDYVTTIRDSSRTLLNILNDILDISKIEAGKMDLKLTSFSFASMIEKTISLFRQNAREQEVSIRWEIDEKIPVFIKADEIRLIQILSNLVSNAIKFSEGGEVFVRAILLGEVKEKYEIEVAVQDNGLGIPPDKLKQLFMSFTQLDSSSKKHFGGTGLGLSISKNLIGLMGGKIDVTSQVGSGSTFSISFHALASKQVKVVNKVISAELVQYLALLKVLVVDDNGTNRKVLSNMLSIIGIKADEAASGYVAIEHCINKHYDLIMMDIQMPEMDGVETLNRLNEDKLIPTAICLAVTAYSMKEDRAKYLKLGFDNYLAKPVTFDALIAKLSEIYESETSVKVIRPKKEPAIFDTNIKKQLINLIGQIGYDSAIEEFRIESQNLIDDYDFSPEGAIHIFHTVKGSAGTLGLEHIANVAAELEQKAIQNHYINFESEFGQLTFLINKLPH